MPLLETIRMVIQNARLDDQESISKHPARLFLNRIFHLASKNSLRAKFLMKKKPMIAVWLASMLTVVQLGCAVPKPVTGTGDDSLAEAWRIISTKRFVDLTHTFSPTTPVWQGF